MEALDRLAEPPLTTALALTRLKKSLHDRRRSIEVSDLVTDHVARLCMGWARRYATASSWSRPMAGPPTRLVPAPSSPVMSRSAAAEVYATDRVAGGRTEA